MNKLMFSAALVFGIASSSFAIAAPYQCSAQGGSTSVMSERLPSLSAARSNALFKCRSRAKKPSLCHWTTCKNLRHSR